MMRVMANPDLPSRSAAAGPIRLPPQQEATLVITRADGSQQRVALTLRIDTPIEVEYYRHGGILPFVLRQLLAA